jgi:pimeloyl-ACP methyl ester carboxylesterase
VTISEGRAVDAPPAIAYDRTGDGPPLVLLHPLGGDRRVWDPVVPLLAPHREVIAVDLPGFGASPVLAEAPAPERLALAVHRFIASLGVERPHVAGNSLGGWVALELALAGHAASVTAIAPAGLWAQPLVPRRSAARRIARAVLPALPLLTLRPGSRRLALAGTVARPENVPASAAARLVRAYARAPGFDAANDAMRSGRFTGLARVPVPMAFGWPEFDRLVGRPGNIPSRAREYVLRGCGHLPMWDDPEQVAALLLEGSRAD